MCVTVGDDEELSGIQWDKPKVHYAGNYRGSDTPNTLLRHSLKKHIRYHPDVTQTFSPYVVNFGTFQLNVLKIPYKLPADWGTLAPDVKVQCVHSFCQQHLKPEFEGMQIADVGDFMLNLIRHTHRGEQPDFFAEKMVERDVPHKPAHTYSRAIPLDETGISRYEGSNTPPRDPSLEALHTICYVENPMSSGASNYSASYGVFQLDCMDSPITLPNEWQNWSSEEKLNMVSYLVRERMKPDSHVSMQDAVDSMMNVIYCSHRHVLPSIETTSYIVNTPLMDTLARDLSLNTPSYISGMPSRDSLYHGCNTPLMDLSLDALDTVRYVVNPELPPDYKGTATYGVFQLDCMDSPIGLPESWKHWSPNDKLQIVTSLVGHHMKKTSEVSQQDAVDAIMNLIYCSHRNVPPSIEPVSPSKNTEVAQSTSYETAWDGRPSKSDMQKMASEFVRRKLTESAQTMTTSQAEPLSTKTTSSVKKKQPEPSMQTKSVVSFIVHDI